MPRRAPIIPVLAIAIATLTPGAHAQDDARTTISRPAFAGRVARAFGFEEQDTNPLPVPRGWFRAQHDPNVPRDRPGFPIWNRAVLDYTSPAHSGTATVKLPTEGGSTSLILRHGELTIFPNADYVLSVRVRTRNLVHARARLVASFVDNAGVEIQGTRAGSQLVRSESEWTVLTVLLEGTEPDAAFINVELQLLQPEQHPSTRAAPEFVVWEQDYNGAAWFDDLIIAQIPMITLATDAPGNVVADQDPPTLDLHVRDLTGESLRTSVVVRSAAGDIIDSTSYEHGTARLRQTWTPDLPGFGWYHATLDVTSSGVLVGRRDLDFAWTPQPHDTLPGAFRLGITTTNPKLIAQLPDIARSINVSGVDLPLWDASTDTQATEPSPILRAVDQLVRAGLDVSLSIDEVPVNLADAAALDPDAVYELIVDHPPIAMPALGPILDRYGQVVERWRLGHTDTMENASVLAPRLASAHNALDPYIPGAVIAVPWAPDRAFEPALILESTALTISADPAFTDRAFDDLVSAWNDARTAAQDPDDTALAIRIAADTAQRSPRTGRDRAANLARRAVSAWWALAKDAQDPRAARVTLDDPFRVEPGKRGRVTPTPELAVWRTLSDTLGSRIPIAEIPLHSDARMLLCSPPAGSTDPADAALVVWRDRPDDEPTTIRIPLSMGPVHAIDIFGNSTTYPLSRSTDLQLPAHEIPVTREPTIILGVNPQLVQTLASLRLAPDQLDATSGIHKHELILDNPYPFRIRGKIYIVEPGGYTTQDDTPVDRSWELNPRVVRFVLDPGESLREPISIAYSTAQIAGPKPLVFDIELAADQDYPLIRVPKAIDLDSDLLDLDLNITRQRSETGELYTVLDARILNRAAEPVLIDVSAVAPRQPRQGSTVNALEPQAAASREFLFKDLRSGDRVVVTARIDTRNVTLNKELIIP